MEHLLDNEDLPSSGGRVSGALGLLSALLLASSFVWAHHWGPLAYAVVAGWALAMMLALLFGVRTLRMRGRIESLRGSEWR